MCSFIYGCALSKPILGPYFELPKKHPPQRNLIFDSEYRDITDVSAIIDTQKRQKTFSPKYFDSIDFCIPIHGYGTICR